MKTPMPEPVAWLYEAEFSSGSYSENYFDWRLTQNKASTRGARNIKPLVTESQLKAAMVAAYNEAIEDAAKECEGMKVRAVRSNYEDAYRHAASAIRKLKEQTP